MTEGKYRIILTFFVKGIDFLNNMDILFKTKKLEKIFNSEAKLFKTYGECAKQIEKRMADLVAADNLTIMKSLPGRTEELKGDRKGQLSIRVGTNWRLIFEPANDPMPTKEDGGLDWSGVTSIKIIEVEDYHG